MRRLTGMMRIKMVEPADSDNFAPTSERQLAIRVLSNADDSQMQILSEWAKGLLVIRSSNDSMIKKGREAIRFTAKSAVIIPLLKIIAKEIKIDQFDASKLTHHSKDSILKSITSFWSNRSFPTKIGLGASSVALVLFGTQGAGIAALGTAIGVPLWVVFGAGATFAAVLYEEVTGTKFDSTLIEGRRKETLKNKFKNVLQRRKNKEDK